MSVPPCPGLGLPVVCAPGCWWASCARSRGRSGRGQDQGDLRQVRV